MTPHWTIAFHCSSSVAMVSRHPNLVTIVSRHPNLVTIVSHPSSLVKVVSPPSSSGTIVSHQPFLKTIVAHQPVLVKAASPQTFLVTIALHDSFLEMIVSRHSSLVRNHLSASEVFVSQGSLTITDSQRRVDIHTRSGVICQNTAIILLQMFFRNTGYFSNWQSKSSHQNWSVTYLQVYLELCGDRDRLLRFSPLPSESWRWWRLAEWEFPCLVFCWRCSKVSVEAEAEGFACLPAALKWARDYKNKQKARIHAYQTLKIWKCLILIRFYDFTTKFVTFELF